METASSESVFGLLNGLQTVFGVLLHLVVLLLDYFFHKTVEVDILA